MIFLDTCALLDLQEAAFKQPFCVASTTLKELEDIKVSANKDQEIKYRARNICRLLLKNIDKVRVVLETSDTRNAILNRNLPLTSDNTILQLASEQENCEFVTHDILCRLIAKDVFHLDVADIQTEQEDVYNGYKQIQIPESEYNTFLSDLKSNRFNCLINEYVILYDDEYEIREIFKWTGGEYVTTYNKPLKSISMGDKIKPKDEFQRCAIDSLMTNTFTILSGLPGSGKTLCALSALMYMVDSGRLQRVVITTNPTPTRGVKEMGFLPGSLTDKILGSNLGNILASKFGDSIQVELLVQQGKIRLLDMASARGCEIKDGEGLLVTEAQNTSIDLMKILLSRVSSGAKVVVEGDYMAQVDNVAFAGNNNGLKRAIEAFKGDPLFGHVYLPNVHRSKIAELAEKL